MKTNATNASVAATAGNNLTPYLKAILNGAVRQAHQASQSSNPARNYELEAATRYIRESAQVKR